MTKSIAMYVRVSTEEQNTAGQIADMERWIDRSGINTESVAWFEDHETGTRMSRDNFNRLQAAINEGTITTVVVWKLDRISRNMLDGMNVVANWAKQGVRVVSVTQQIDMNGVLGQMMAAMLFGFAQIEHQYRAERQAAGIRIAKGKGIYKGRAKGTVKADPSRAMALRDKGLAVAEIATAMGCSVRTIHRYLDAN